MIAAKKMVRELKGKEKAIKWGIERREKKEEIDKKKVIEKDHRYYYDVMRRQFIDFISR